MLLTDFLANHQIDSSIITIGSFDGVHIGHQAILHSISDLAKKKNRSSIAITFFPHPAVVIKEISHPYYLTSPSIRAGLIKSCGIDQVITLPFTPALSNLNAESFCAELVVKLGMKCLIAGPDFSIGKDRKGNIDVLKKIGEVQGFEVIVIREVNSNGIKVSSSQIRRFLQTGDVHNASLMLGRYHSISGEVVRGDGRGKALGIPTANLLIWDEQLIPANGVYATKAWIDGIAFASTTNIGERPTFEKKHVSKRVETLILDFDRDIYGKTLIVEFVAFLRKEQRFESINLLLDQINTDIQRTREVFKNGIPKNIFA